MSKKPVIDPNTPALAFINIPGQQEIDENGEIREAALEPVPELKGEDPKSTDRAKKAGGTVDYIKEKQQTVEAKSRRLQLLIKPSIYDRVKAAADKYGISVNSYIEAAIEERLEKE